MNPYIEKIVRYEKIQWWQKSQPLVDGVMDEWIKSAQGRLERFEPYFMAQNKDTYPMQGKVESKLIPLNKLAKILPLACTNDHLLNNQLFLKGDHALPISGSIKARGGIHEVLEIAERVAKKADLIDSNRDYTQFASDEYKRLFGEHTILVGSTGNLGLSIGLMGAQLGFNVEVHMSKDAKAWKISRLQTAGAKVVLHEGDYGQAVATARKLAIGNPNAHFIDDEQSIQLFAGYAVGGLRLKSQLDEMNIVISSEQPLYVYLPCGVGGGPGGVAYGIKQVFGDWVYPVFIEPTHAPCFTLAMVQGGAKAVNIGDYSLDNTTEADGLAVGCASELALAHAGPLLYGLVTVDDEQLFRDLTLLADTEGIYIEPSAAAGFEGLRQVINRGAHPKGIHILWATGGSLVPEKEMSSYYERGLIK